MDLTVRESFYNKNIKRNMAFLEYVLKTVKFQYVCIINIGDE